MPNNAPEQIAIDHDDYHAEHLGHLPDGRQFFLTTPFVPAYGGVEGSEFVALYLFDEDGALLESKIENFGPRATMDEIRRKAVYDEWLRDLGEVVFDRIEVAPFVIEREGIQFGLVPRPPEDEEDEWAVEMQPGNYMAFFAPWDSGVYDT